MKALARLERLIQDLVERPGWLLGTRRLHPLEMAAALTRALERNALPLADRVLIPDAYAITLSHEDFAAFAEIRRTLERELAAYVGRLAAERGLTLNAEPSVALQPAAEVRPGAVQIITRFSEAAAEHVAAAGTLVRRRPAPARGGRTERVAVARNGPVVAGPAALEVLAPDGTVLRRLPLPNGALVIGRRASSGLLLADPEVSRQHARIEYIAPRYYLADLDSTNGTFVNGRRIHGRHPLADGDTIDVGQTRLRFRRGG